MIHNRKQFEKMILTFIVVLIIILIGVGIFFKYNSNEIEYQQGIEIFKVTQTLEEKIAEVKQELIDTLSYECEVAGSEEPDGVIIFDTNEKMSVGKYQWQRESIKYYVKKFYNRDIKNDEAIAIAIGWHPDIDIDEFTLRVLFEEPKGYTNWHNCSNKFNLSREIEIIKKFEE